MTLSYSSPIRTAMVDTITAGIGNAGLLRIYDGVKPAAGGAATTLLAELTGASPWAPGGAAGVVTASAITQDASANATGTATWFRWVTAASAYCVDGTVTASGGGGDLQLTTTSIVATQPVSCTSFVVTEGNP